MLNFSINLRSTFLVLLFVVAACGDNAFSEALPDSTFVPEFPPGLYRGPFDGWISAQEAAKKLTDSVVPIKYGTEKIPGIVWVRRIKGHTYKVYLDKSGLTVDLKSTDDQHLHLPGSALVMGDQGFYGVRWYARITRYSEDEYCSFETKVLGAQDPNTPAEFKGEGSDPLPEGTIVNTWECWVPGARHSNKYWVEAIMQDGTIVRRSKENIGSWESVDPAVCWSCHPEQIPKEARFDDDPLAEFLFKKGD